MEQDQRDIRLLNLISKGSKTSFEEFYETYASFVFHIANQVLGDHVEAEDVVHDIFLSIFEHPEKYNPERGSIKAFLAVITKNSAIDRLRRKKPILVQKLEQLETVAEVKTELSVLMQIEQELIMDALEQLPKKQRKIIYSAYFEELTQREMAETYNKPLGTVKSLVRYGLQNLRKQKDLINWMKVR